MTSATTFVFHWLLLESAATEHLNYSAWKLG